MKLLNSNVLVSPIVRNDKIKLSDGKELLLETRFEYNKHAEIVCEVMQVPEEKVVKKDMKMF